MKLFEEIEANKFLNFIKNYLSLIILVPYLLGGIKQLINLSILSTELLDFFSIGQVLIDGIFITIKLLGYFILLILMKKSIKSLELINFGIIFLLILMIFILIVSYFYDIVRNENEFYNLIFLLIYYGLIILTFNIIIKSNFLKFYMYAFSLILIIWFSPSKKDEIVNNNEILKLVYKKYPNATFQYSNDKFLIFNTNSNLNNNKFLILKNEELFNEKILLEKEKN